MKVINAKMNVLTPTFLAQHSCLTIVGQRMILNFTAQGLPTVSKDFTSYHQTNQQEKLSKK